MNLHLKIIVILCCLINLQLIAQNPWAKSKGEGYVQLAYNDVSNYTQLITNSSASRSTERIMSDQTFQLYSEIGIANKLSLIGFIPFKILSAGESNSSQVNLTTEGNLYSIGNSSIAIRKGLSLGKFENSFQLGIELPSNSRNLESGLISGFNAFAFLPYYSIGKSFTSKFYSFIYAGASIRTNGYSNQFRWGLETAYKFDQKLWAIFFIDHLGLIESNNKILDPRIEANGLFLDEQMYFSPGFKFIYELKNKVYINTGIGGAIVANNVAAAPALSFGVSKEW